MPMKRAWEDWKPAIGQSNSGFKLPSDIVTGNCLVFGVGAEQNGAGIMFRFESFRIIRPFNEGDITETHF